eukprot:34015_1
MAQLGTEKELTAEQKERVETNRIRGEMNRPRGFGGNEITEGRVRQQYPLTYDNLRKGVLSRDLHWRYKSAYGNTTTIYDLDEIKIYAEKLHPGSAKTAEIKAKAKELRALKKKIKQKRKELEEVNNELEELENDKQLVEQELDELKSDPIEKNSRKRSRESNETSTRKAKKARTTASS